MNKYKIEFTLTDFYCIDVLADDEARAIEIAKIQFEKDADHGMLHYKQTRDSELEVHQVYDVTNTDDPFDPETPCKK